MAAEKCSSRRPIAPSLDEKQMPEDGAQAQAQAQPCQGAPWGGGGGGGGNGFF
jgi:hypothetical protein